jgi:pimeloyl-ACP methyl ester carboxylesterase
MIERVVTLGVQHTVVGILTEPEPGARRTDVPTVILLNAGLLPRIGPHRTYVTLARGLAAQGVSTLRLDLSGHGDSDNRADDLSYVAGAVSDTRLAMNHLAQTTGTTSFVLGGLCSGADNSFLTALEDDRVHGAILLDWYAYRTPGFYIRYLSDAVLRPSAWRTAFLRWVRVLIRLRPVAGPAVMDPFARVHPPKKAVRYHFDLMLERGMRFLCIYTGGQYTLYNHAGQFGKMFGALDFRGLVRTEYFAGSDHTFTLVRDQERLVETVCGWFATQSWAAPDAAVEDAN